ncbi:MAG: DUF5606 domain-containing protein [Rikenellaceae bacterium]
MKLKEVLAISGQSGLYKFIAQSQRGIIVESLLDGRRTNTPQSARVSALNEISIFTEGEDIPLGQLFDNMFAYYKGEQGVNHKDTDARIKEGFALSLPEYDRERVRLSDMKKAFAWYNILVAAGMTSFTDSEEELSEQQGEE